jgi:hypothetical protein
MTTYKPLSQPHFQPYTRPAMPDGWRELVERRRVKRWKDFPPTTKRVYQQIADCFPGLRVYACGSRVTGQWCDESTTLEFRKGRIAAGYKNKTASDFDFWMDRRVEPVRPLPDGADWVRLRVTKPERIMLPGWKFERLPAERHAEVRALISACAWQRLIDIHDEYRLSEYDYRDCCTALDGLKRWYFYALDNGLLNGGKEVK